MADAVRELALQCCEAALDPERWPEVVTRISEVADVPHTAFLIHGEEGPDLIWPGVDEEVVQRFASQQSEFYALAAAVPYDRVFEIEDFIPTQAFRETQFYRQVIRPAGGGAGLGFQLRCSGGYLMLMLGQPLGREYGRRQKALLRDLLPAVRIAVDVHIARQRSQRERAIAHAAAEASEQPMMVLDREGRLLLVTARAEALLDGPLGWRRTTDGRVHDPLGRLGRAVAELFAMPFDEGYGELLIAAPGDKRHWRAYLRRTHEGQAVTVRLAPAGLGESLGERFGLTSQEQKVARLVVEEALPTRAIAERLNISVNTARTHLARVLGKTGVHRQAELIALLRQAE